MNYIKHIGGKIGKATQGIGVIKRLYNYLPYYRFINLLYDLTWTTVMSFIINQLMMIFIAIIILKEQNLIR